MTIRKRANIKIRGKPNDDFTLKDAKNYFIRSHGQSLYDSYSIGFKKDMLFSLLGDMRSHPAGYELQMAKWEKEDATVKEEPSGWGKIRKYIDNPSMPEPDFRQSKYKINQTSSTQQNFPRKELSDKIDEKLPFKKTTSVTEFYNSVSELYAGGQNLWGEIKSGIRHHEGKDYKRDIEVNLHAGKKGNIQYIDRVDDEGIEELANRLERNFVVSSSDEAIVKVSLNESRKNIEGKFKVYKDPKFDFPSDTKYQSKERSFLIESADKKYQGIEFSGPEDRPDGFQLPIDFESLFS